MDRRQSHAPPHDPGEGVDAAVGKLVACRFAIARGMPAVLRGFFTIARGQFALIGVRMADGCNSVSNLGREVTILGGTVSLLCRRVASRCGEEIQ